MKSNAFKRVFSGQPNTKSRIGEGLSPSFLPSFLAVLVILLASGCKKESKLSELESETPSFYKNSEDVVCVSEGVLCFEDMPTFEYYFPNLLNASDSSRKLQESIMGL